MAQSGHRLVRCTCLLSGVERTSEFGDRQAATGRAAVVVVGQRAQRRRAVAGEGRAVHQRERARRELGEAADRRAHAGIEAGIAEQVLRRDRRADDVALASARGRRRAG